MPAPLMYSHDVRKRFLALAVLALCAGCSAERLPTTPTDSDHPDLMVAFMTERPPSPAYSADIYFYDYRTGGPAYDPPNVNSTSLEGPCSLSGDGRRMVFYTNRQVIGSTAVLWLYDVATHELRAPAKINELFLAAPNPALSANGRYLAAQYQLGGPFDQWITMTDLEADTLFQLPNLNDPNSTNWDPCVNGDGTLIAFTSNRLGGRGGWDVYLYSVPADTLIPLPGLDTPENEMASSISADGRYIAFQHGHGNADSLYNVRVYDRFTQSLLPLPGANTQLGEVQPALSPDGRYLAYMTDPNGGGDVRVYDIRQGRQLPVDWLNVPYYKDFFPALAIPK
jgi:Tol biopolymer transport system component